MGEVENFDQVLEKARRLAQERYPNAAPQRHATFANSVAELVTGFSGGYGGPSVRELAVARLYGPAASFSFEEAVRVLLAEDGPIFGPLTSLHRQVWREEGEHSFDNDPQDLEELSRFRLEPEDLN